MYMKHLYNIETDTLLSLDPSSSSIQVKNSFMQTYFLSIERFTVIYFLFNAYPHIVTYKEFHAIFDEIAISYGDKKKFDKNMTALKKELSSCGVKNLISKVRGHGYCISNKWVPPEQNTESKKKERFARLTKLFAGVLQRDRS